MPDKGPNGEHIVDWHHLNGEILRVAPWILEPKRPMGCQFINTHNVAVSEVFNCNTNIAIGGPDTVYYATVYGSKNTQADDVDQQQAISNSANKRLLRVEQEILDGTCKVDKVQDGFVEGLYRILAGMNAATLRYNVSTVMSHLMVCNGGTWF